MISALSKGVEGHEGINPDALGWRLKVVEMFPSAGDLINKLNQLRLAGPAATFIRIFPTSDDFVSFLLDSIVMAINQDPRLLIWIGSQSQETLENMAAKIVSNISTSLRSDSFFCDLGLNGSNRMFVNQAARIVNDFCYISSDRQSNPATTDQSNSTAEQPHNQSNSTSAASERGRGTFTGTNTSSGDETFIVAYQHTSMQEPGCNSLIDLVICEILPPKHGFTH